MQGPRLIFGYIPLYKVIHHNADLHGFCSFQYKTAGMELEQDNIIPDN